MQTFQFWKDSLGLVRRPLAGFGRLGPGGCAPGAGMAVCGLLMRSLALGDLEGSPGSFPDLVQLDLQGIDLPFHLFEGCTFRSDEQAPVLASGVAQEGNPDGCRVVWCSRLDVQLKGSEYVHACVSLGVSVPYRFGTASGLVLAI